MRMCCVTNVLVGCLIGFFLNMCFMLPLYRKASCDHRHEHKHDHKTCGKCVCEKTCKCHEEESKCALKCLCD